MRAWDACVLASWLLEVLVRGKLAWDRLVRTTSCQLAHDVGDSYTFQVTSPADYNLATTLSAGEWRVMSQNVSCSVLCPLFQCEQATPGPAGGTKPERQGT